MPAEGYRGLRLNESFDLYNALEGSHHRKGSCDSKRKKLAVPGGASGIGEAFVHLAAKEGAAEIVIYDVNADAGERRLATEASGCCRFTRLDITDPHAIWAVLWPRKTPAVRSILP